MLEITIPGIEGYDEDKNEFITISKPQCLRLEHSLVSLSKWEAKYKKPFLTNEKKTIGEYIDYVRFMTITQNVDPDVYKRINRDVLNKITEYMEDSMTATTVRERNRPGRREIMTAEVIYYYMIVFGIPFECQKWHLNRLMMLIRVCSAKNGKPQKMSPRAIAEQQAAANAARRKKLHTRG